MKEEFYPKPLGQLPNNENLYVLTEIGAVDYGLGPTEPVWRTNFVRIENKTLLDEGGLSIQLGGSLLSAATLGSVWKKRRNIGSVLGVWTRNIYLNLPEYVTDQTVIYRVEGPKDSKHQFTDEQLPDARPYLLIKILGEPDADFALISCSENYRYYYAYLRSVSRHFFSFDAAGNNEKLFNAQNTGWDLEKQEFIFDPKPNITDLDQKRLAHYLASKTAREAIGLTAASARAQFHRKEKVFPICHIPIFGLNKWRVSGSLRDVMISTEGIGKPFRVLAISRINKCYDVGRVRDVVSTRERTLWNSKDEEHLSDSNEPKNGGRRPPSIDDENIPAISDKPPGNPTRVSPKDLDKLDSDRECWNDVSFRRIGPEKEISLQVKSVSDYPPPDEASTKDDGGGDSKTGKLGKDRWDAQRRKKKEPTVSEEEYRRNLEHIFEFKAPGKLSSEELDLRDLPETLTYLFQSAVQHFNESSDHGGCFIGGESKDFYEDIAPVLVLDPTWGPNTRYRASKDGVRRALVLEIPTNNGFLYFFDLEKKSSEKIGIHVMLFNGRPLSSDQIASILYRRLESKSKRGWPSRKQYSGEFWSASLYHYVDISLEDRGAQIGKLVAQMGGG